MTEAPIRIASDAGGAALRASQRPSPALPWWQQYCDSTNEAADPGMRARLRRARSTSEALRLPAAIDLVRRFGYLKPDTPAHDWQVARVLDLARVLAHVKQHDPVPPMRAAGWKTFPGGRSRADAAGPLPKLSEARFRRLLDTGEGEDLVTAFTRLIALLNGTVNVTELARDFMDWGHPVRGEHTRQRWAFDYYAAHTARPGAITDSTAATISEDEA